jgi:hypothetical protein
MKIVFANAEASNVYRGSGLPLMIEVEKISEWLSDVGQAGMSATIALPHPSDIVVVGVTRADVWCKLSELYEGAAVAQRDRAAFYKSLAKKDDA